MEFLELVRLRAAPDIVLHVTALRGQLISKHRAPPVFDDQRSFYIDVDSAELSVDSASMTALVNDVFGYQGSPLSDLKVALRDGRVKQDGKLKKGIPVPFSVEADVDASGGVVAGQRMDSHTVLWMAGVVAWNGPGVEQFMSEYYRHARVLWRSREMLFYICCSQPRARSQPTSRATFTVRAFHPTSKR